MSDLASLDLIEDDDEFAPLGEKYCSGCVSSCGGTSCCCFPTTNCRD